MLGAQLLGLPFGVLLLHPVSQLGCPSAPIFPSHTSWPVRSDSGTEVNGNNQNQRDPCSSPRSAAFRVCGFGQVTLLLQTSTSLSVRWGEWKWIPPRGCCKDSVSEAGRAFSAGSSVPLLRLLCRSVLYCVVQAGYGLVWEAWEKTPGVQAPWALGFWEETGPTWPWVCKGLHTCHSGDPPVPTAQCLSGQFPGRTGWEEARQESARGGEGQECLMTHLDTASPRHPAPRPLPGDRFHGSDIWFHLRGSNSVSPGLTNGGPADHSAGERCGRPAACQPPENYRARWPSAARPSGPQRAPEGDLLGGRSALHP